MNTDKSNKTRKAIKPKTLNKVGRDTKAINKPIPDYNESRVDDGLDLNELMTPEDIEEINSITPKSPLTKREEKLIMIFLSYPLLEKYKIAKLAGYKCNSKSALCNAFSMVIEKYECSGDHKRIFRQVGLGEARIALRIRELALHAKSEVVALNACQLAAKCMDLTKAEIDLEAGFAVNIKRPVQSAEPVKTGPERSPSVGAGKKPLEVIK